MAHPTHLVASALLTLAPACVSEPDTPQATTYTVVRGDTLTRIARAHGTSVDQLRTDNQLVGDHLEIGQTLQIPADAKQSPLANRATKTATRTDDYKTPGKRGQRMPAKQPCIAGPTLSGSEQDDPEMVSSKGLTLTQIRHAMDPAIAQTSHCVAGTWPSGVITLRLTVACNGRVDTVQILDNGGMETTLVTCVQQTLRYTGFPAHDMPDGYSFDYPLRFSVDTP